MHAKKTIKSCGGMYIGTVSDYTPVVQHTSKQIILTRALTMYMYCVILHVHQK
jgi:hypothetical protein